MNTNPSPSTNPNIPITNIPELSQQSMSRVPDVPTIPPTAYQATSVQTTTTLQSPKRKYLMSQVPDVPTIPRPHPSSAPNIPTTNQQHNHPSSHTNLNVSCPGCLKQPTYISGIIGILGSLSNHPIFQMAQVPNVPAVPAVTHLTLHNHNSNPNNLFSSSKRNVPCPGCLRSLKYLNQPTSLYYSPLLDSSPAS